MCEKRIKMIKKGGKGQDLANDATRVNRARELRARRIHRLLRLAFSPIESSHLLPAEREMQNRILVCLAWKTVALMQKNRVIQQKLVELQKETSEYINTIMSNPENKERYLEYLRVNKIKPPPGVLEHSQNANVTTQ